MENKMVENQTKSLYEEFIEILEETMVLIEKKTTINSLYSCESNI